MKLRNGMVIEKIDNGELYYLKEIEKSPCEEGETIYSAFYVPLMDMETGIVNVSPEPSEMVISSDSSNYIFVALTHTQVVVDLNSTRAYEREHCAPKGVDVDLYFYLKNLPAKDLDTLKLLLKAIERREEINETTKV